MWRTSGTGICLFQYISIPSSRYLRVHHTAYGSRAGALRVLYSARSRNLAPCDPQSGMEHMEKRDAYNGR